MTPAPRTLAEVGRELRPSTCCACVAELEGEVKRLVEENETLREEVFELGHFASIARDAEAALTETPEREG